MGSALHTTAQEMNRMGDLVLLNLCQGNLDSGAIDCVYRNPINDHPVH